MEKRAPSPRGKKPPKYLFSHVVGGGGGERILLLMGKCDYKMHNICGKYSSHNYMKMPSTLHPVELFIKKVSSEEHILESSSNKIEHRYTHCMIYNASGMYYNASLLSQKLYSHVWTWIFTLDKWPFV